MTTDRPNFFTPALILAAAILGAGLLIHQARPRYALVPVERAASVARLDLQSGAVIIYGPAGQILASYPGQKP